MAETARKGIDAVQDKASEFLNETVAEQNELLNKESQRSSFHGGEKVDSTKEKITNETESKSLVDTVREKAAEAFNFVAGGSGDGESKGLVGTVREKAAGAYNYVAEKVSEATHAVTGDSNKDPTKEATPSIGSRVSAAVDAVKDKAIEVTSEVLK